MAKFKVGDRVWFKAPVTGVKVTAKITATLGGEKYGFVDDDGIQGTIEGNAIYPLNSRSCNSQNPIVANAMNAAGVKGGNYEVTLETVTLKGNSTSSTTMTDAQLKAWLGLIHQNGIYSEAISRFARGEKYYDAYIDMHPTVHIRMI